MRYIVIFLLLCNLAYFGWNTYRGQTAPAPLVTAERPLLNNGLMLASEFQALSEEIRQENRESSQICYVIGAFANVDEARNFMMDARNMGYQTRLNLTGEPLPPQYRVFLPPASSREVATITLDGLSEQLAAESLGIETYLITRGVLENGIALGVFSLQLNALNVQLAIEALGYTVEIEEIPRSEGEVQVVLEPADFDLLDEAEWLDLSATRPYLSLTENLCQTIAQVSQFP